MAQTYSGKRAYKYDELDRLVSVDYGDGRKAVYRYDETGNIVATMTGSVDELVEPARVEERAVIEERTEPAPPPAAEVALRCASCGAELRPDAKFCKSCGAQVVQAQAPQVKYCRNCGSQLAPDAAFCGKCGTAVR